MDSISKRWGEISVFILVVILCTCTGSIVITAGGIKKAVTGHLIHFQQDIFANRKGHFSKDDISIFQNSALDKILTIQIQKDFTIIYKDKELLRDIELFALF